MVIWGPLAVFLVSLVADYGTSAAAIRRGYREGNPVLAANPIIVAVISAGIVIGLGVGFYSAGYAGWAPIFYVGSGIHAIATIWNVILLAKGK